MPNIKEDSIARKYGKAFLDVVVEMYGLEKSKDLEPKLKELSVLSSGECGRFFSNPVFSHEEKVAVLEKLLEEQKTDGTLKRFLTVLSQNGHLDLITEIAAAYEDAGRDRRNELEANLRSAFPLKDAMVERIRKALGQNTGKTVLLNVEVDKELIGGLVAEVDGVVYDASVRGYVNRLQEEF